MLLTCGWITREWKRETERKLIETEKKTRRIREKTKKTKKTERRQRREFGANQNRTQLNNF